MFKKTIIAAIIGLSFHAAVPQAHASSVAHINTSVVVSGPGGMCRDVTIITEYTDQRRAAYDTRVMLRGQMHKTRRDYITTHRAVSMRYGSLRRINNSIRPRIRAGGRVCFRSL